MKKISNLIFLLSGILLLSACSGSGADGPSHEESIMSLPQELNAVAEQLSGKLTIYDSQGKIVSSKDLTFSEDENGNTVVSSTPLSLKKSATYRFVLVYYWDDLPIAYVDSTQATKNAESTTISFTTEMIVYDPPQGLSADESAGFEADITANIIPDLDTDDDGFSNFIEIRSGSDPNKKSSVPSGPEIADFKAVISGDGNTLTISATITDGNGITSTNLNFTGADYLNEVTTKTINGSAGDETWDFEAQVNPQYAPLGDLEIALTAVNGIGLSSQASATVTVTDNGTNVGPVIDFESVSEGDTLGGTVILSLHAYDRDGVSEVKVTQPSALSNTSTDPERFIANWDTMSAADGAFTLRATATDAGGTSSNQTLSVTISNGTDVTGPNISLIVSQSNDSSNIFDYQNGESVYGKIEIHASASDATGVASLSLLNAVSLGEALGTPSTATNTTYINTIDTTQLSDGLLSLQFSATDDEGHENNRTFSLTVTNHPSINSFTVNGATNVNIAAGETVTFDWSTSNADDVSITNIDTGDVLFTNLALNGTKSAAISATGTYRLIATRTTNVSDFSETGDVTIFVDDGDGDGFGPIGTPGGTDCNDNDPEINPDATDTLNGLDDNCDGNVDHIDLSNTDADIRGTLTDDYLGYSVATTDVNGDGYDDILVGAYLAEENGMGNSGAVYLFYGPVSGSFDAANADAIFMGEGNADNAGHSVAAAGDVDSDLYGDFLIGARYHNGGGVSDTGAAYLIYGSSTPYAGSISLANYAESAYQNPSPGLAIAKFTGEDSYDDAGWAVSSAGDVNGDTYADILIVAHAEDTGGYNSGAAYLIYGSETRFIGNTDLCYASATCTPSIGAKFYGELAEDYMTKASSAGDVDNDGYDDFLVGVGSHGTDDSGAAYLIYGKSAKFTGDKKVNIIANAKFSGGLSGDQAGNSVAPAGDFNNDGISDFLIGANYANYDGKTDNGIAYLIYGLSDLGRYSGNIDLGSDINGVKFFGEKTSDRAGVRIAPAGDVNGDEISDIIVSATYADSATDTDTGAAYLIYGVSGGFPNSAINLSEANSKFMGIATNDYAGQSIVAGMFDDDGLSDILIGAYGVNRGSNANAGKAYLILSNY